jgi:hypothetical protein
MMRSAQLAPFVLGAISMGSAVAALFFARYYRDTRDRIFIYFAAAFAVEAVNRAVLAFERVPVEATPVLYLLRAASYTLILIGVFQKNRRR